MPRIRTPRTVVAAIAMAGLLGGCAGAGAIGGGAGKTQLTIAIVANPQMQDAVSLAPQFERTHPNIQLKFVTLPENEARAKVTASVATSGGEYDITMISNYETQMWAQNGWLTDLQPYIDETSGYDPNDIIPSIHDSLSYKGDLYSVPFYGESSFLVYRKDLFAKAGLTMPAHPTWPQVAALAKKLNDPKHNVSGICLRGLPGWGEVLAPLDTVINTFGGRWFDQNWHPQLTSPQFRKAVQFYVNTVRAYGEPGAATSGFSECVTRYSQGQAAMWYDATSMVSTVEDKSSSVVVGKNGYAPAPVVDTKSAGWLYTWSLGVPKTSMHKDAAWQFIDWMTNKEYIKTVGKQLGWARVPPGSRLSTYQIPQVKQAAKAYAGPTLQALRTADERKPTVQAVPYQGIQFLRIPEFQDLGTRVSQQVAAAIAGNITVDQALRQSQQYAETVGASYRK
ncbi:MAG: sugar ABC transporter substrate-binding protein [Streptosporangiales bacterium]|nr:sugar ABC transporter substrate-binding protein [Streptosporangiales bacterium]